MDKDKPQSNIPNTDKVAITIPDPGIVTNLLTPEQVQKDTDSKFKTVNGLLLSVVMVLLFMVATLVIDSFHFNSVTYKEYSQKENSIEQMQKINQELLEQNKKNQLIIIEQQKQIWRIIGKK
ncbi:MAG: hypothetical protein A2X78_03215 [Gammaproteobacteria bacterium GWE2_37_16]|nr:MAG: hypothetical protein A2X78_03215 [Gammaproteobacteria bacterium GWE2_37_16]